MAYIRQTFVDEETVLKAEHLNHIEEGIVANEDAISKKQDTLKSGENIKTINGQSVLGPGNVEVGGGEGIPVSRIVAGVLRYDGTKWTILNNEGHIPINITGVSGDSPDSVTITFPKYAKVNSLVATPDETLAAAGIKCGASVGVDYATIHLRQDRQARLFVQMNSSGTKGTVTRYEGDERTDISGFTVTMKENTTLGNYVRIDDSKENIDGKSIPAIGGAYTCYLLGSKAGYANIQLRNPDGSVSDYKDAQIQMSLTLLNSSPVLTSYETQKGNVWVYGIMEE